jgi:DNA-binding beta-propeller fold protein YncE
MGALPGERRRILGISVLLLVVAVLVSIPALRLTTATPVLATVAVGPNPGASPGVVAVDEQTGRAFVSDGTNAVSMLDTASGTFLRTTRVGANPFFEVVDSRSGHVFVINRDEDTVSMLDAGSGALLRATVVGAGSRSVAVDERTERLFVPSADDASVSILNAQSGGTIATISLPGPPVQAAVDEQSGHVFIPRRDGNLSVLDARTGAVLRTVRVDASAWCPSCSGCPDSMMVTVSRRTGRVFVANPLSKTLSMLDVHSGVLLRRVAVGVSPTPPIVDEQTVHVFIGDMSSTTVRMLDARSGLLLRTVGVGAAPMAIAVDTRTGDVLVTTLGPTVTSACGCPGNATGVGRVEVLDGRSGARLRTIAVGVSPAMTVVDERTRHAFVLNTNVNPDGEPLTAVRVTEGGWEQAMRRLKQAVPWLPLPVPPRPIRPTHGTVSVLDLSRL